MPIYRDPYTAYTVKINMLEIHTQHTRKSVKLSHIKGYSDLAKYTQLYNTPYTVHTQIAFFSGIVVHKNGCNRWYDRLLSVSDSLTYTDIHSSYTHTQIDYELYFF